ncbi:MAG TPA: YceI family protein [Steroidobacteraceae bacterium]|nr:YceI family protein [Steroidobacteraceae bacterium]
MNRLRPAFALLTLSVALSAPAWAAPITYIPNADHTFARFSYDHLGFSTQESRFDKVTGTVTFDPAAKTGAVDIVIDTKAVNTGSEKFNGNIQGPEFFDTSQFPTATFKSTSVKFDGDRPVSIVGELTLKGITKPVTLTVTSFKHAPNMMKKDSIGANATTVISRSDFQMVKYVPLIGDDVTVTIAIEAATQ